MKKLITIHLLTILAFAGYAWHNYNKPVVFQKRVLEHNFEINGVDNRLVEAIIQVESGGNPLAVSHKSAYGIMQIQLPTAKQYCGISDKNELFKVDVNINCATTVLREYIKIAQSRGHGLKEGLKYYNAGPWSKNPKLGEQYAIKVLGMYAQL